MRAFARRATDAMRAVDDGLLALRAGMTPGQRWTATLAMALTVLVLVYGLPRHVIVVPGAEGAEVAGATSRAPHGAASAVPPAALDVAAAAGPPSLADTLAAVLPPAPGEPGATSPATPSAAVFAALVRVGDRPEPGHDDASIAKTFVSRSRRHHSRRRAPRRRDS